MFLLVRTLLTGLETVRPAAAAQCPSPATMGCARPDRALWLHRQRVILGQRLHSLGDRPPLGGAVGAAGVVGDLFQLHRLEMADHLVGWRIGWTAFPTRGNATG